MRDNGNIEAADRAELERLVITLKEQVGALEVWLFGSRARGDHRPDSDYDVLAVVPDETSYEPEDLTFWIHLRQDNNVRLPVDLMGVSISEHLGCREAPMTICGAVWREGFRLDD